MQSVSAAFFSAVQLDSVVVPAGTMFGRIYHARFGDPLGFGKAPSRFSDPRHRKAENRFGVLYLGSSLKVCMVETLVRDARDSLVGPLLLAEAELMARRYAEIETLAPLNLVDLRGDGPVRMGIPSDVARGHRQTLARRWSVVIHEHPDNVDGIIYASRLTGDENVALYDRAIGKIHSRQTGKLAEEAGLADILNRFMIALV